MKIKSDLIVLPAFTALILTLTFAGYKVNEGFEGPRQCLTGIENERSVSFNNLAEIGTLNTRLIDEHWVSAVAFFDRNEDKKVTFLCHFQGKSHSYDWSEIYRGNEIASLKLTSTSIVSPKTW